MRSCHSSSAHPLSLCATPSPWHCFGKGLVFILAKPSPHGGLLFFLICMEKWDSRTSLDLLPNGSCLPLGLRAVEGRWGRGKDLDTSSSLAQTAAGIQAGQKKQEADVEERFMGGTVTKVLRLMARGCKEDAPTTGPMARAMSLGGQGQPGTAQVLLDVTSRQGGSRGRSAAPQDPCTQRNGCLQFADFFFSFTGWPAGRKGGRDFRHRLWRPGAATHPGSLLRSNALSPALADHYRAALLCTALLTLGFLNHPQSNSSPHQVTPSPQP